MKYITGQIEQWGPIDAVVLYMSYWYWPSGPGITKKYKISWPKMWAYFKDRRITFWWKKSDMQMQGELAFKKYLLDEAKLKKIRKEYYQTWKRLLTLEKLITKEADKNHPKPQLAKLVGDIYDCMMDFWCVSLIFEEANYTAPDHLKEKLIGKIPDRKIPRVLEVLLAPTKISFHQQGESELLKNYLAAKSKAVLKEKLKRHAKKWYWVENSYYEPKKLSTEDFELRLRGVSKTQARAKLNQMDGYYAAVKKKKHALIKKYGLGPDVAKSADLLSFSIWWQDDRKAKVWQTISAMEKLARMLGVKHGILLTDLVLYTAEEFTALAKNGKSVSKSKLQKRLNGTLFKIFPQSYSKQDGDAARKFVKQFSKQDKPPTSKKALTGIVVSKSKKPICAKARILLSPRDGKNMQKGEILIAPMTSPDFVPFMRKAAAIVTDTGGLMSHAAVISRELGIPCITNTKIATELFKNDDLVEVDTNKGIVKKL